MVGSRHGPSSVHFLSPRPSTHSSLTSSFRSVCGPNGEILAPVGEGQLRRARSNVLLNAVEAYDRAPPETVRRVRIAAAKVRGDTHVAIRVADGGCGMSEAAGRQGYRPFGRPQ